jgi:hypothetical protein
MHPRWWHETKDYSCVIEAAGSKIWTTHIDQRGIETEVYFTDSKEHIASPLYKKDQMQAKTYWDGNILVVEKRREEGGLGGSVWTSRYELSGDGKFLQVSGHFLKSSSSDEPFDVIRTFEKQPR